MPALPPYHRDLMKPARFFLVSSAFALFALAACSKPSAESPQPPLIEETTDNAAPAAADHGLLGDGTDAPAASTGSADDAPEVANTPTPSQEEAPTLGGSTNQGGGLQLQLGGSGGGYEGSQPRLQLNRSF